MVLLKVDETELFGQNLVNSQLGYNCQSDVSIPETSCEDGAHAWHQPHP
jgi:hypothetical protein